MPAYGRGRDITGSGLSSIVAQQGRRGIIKSFQARTVTIAGASLTGTDTFTAVDLTNTIIMHVGQSATATTGNLTSSGWAGLSASGTTMTATRTGTTNALIVAYHLIEFFPGIIRSLQRGTKAINGSATTYDQTITAVQDINKCLLIDMGMSGDTNTWDGEFPVYRNLTTTTNLRFSSAAYAGGGLSQTAYWQVVEFY